MSGIEDKPLVVTVATALKISALSRTTIYRMINSGQLASKVIGRKRLISYAALEALLLTPGGPKSATTNLPQHRRAEPPEVMNGRAVRARGLDRD
jgi:excisionase family DNA binding protein